LVGFKHTDVRNNILKPGCFIRRFSLFDFNNVRVKIENIYWSRHSCQSEDIWCVRNANDDDDVTDARAYRMVRDLNKNQEQMLKIWQRLENNAKIVAAILAIAVTMHFCKNSLKIRDLLLIISDFICFF